MTACSFNEPTLRSGDQGNAVRLLQTCLQQYSVDFPGTVLSPGAIDGDFGPTTEASLRSFQTNFGSGPADGIAGPITWSQLDLIDNHGFPFAPGSDLLQGATGNPVRRLQRLLFAAAVDPGSVDGIYGPNTATAVRTFEQNEGLPQTGNAAGQTRVTLTFVFG
jgi:peptidoglycan hydrolase-like protein with peptidoglycan-binding domain